ncbi:MAG TPA: HlyD family efflux transporter periplasmic adaptor subunit, partial [Ktedonobacteraceae bacterium]
AAGRNYVQSALNLLKRALQEHTAFVAAGQNALRAAQINLNATYQQDQANITVTQVTLADDEQVLIDTRIQAAAQIQAAQVQLIQNKAACQTAFNTDSSSQRQSSSAPTAADLLKVCLQAAQTQLQQSVANAQSPVVSALATVVNDRVLLAQAIASARADVVGAQGAVVVARDQVPIAIYETGPFEAERDVTDAQHALALDLGAFWNAQVALTNSLLLAPHDGVVTAINGTIGSSPGTTVDIASFAPGSGPSGTFIQLIDLSRVDQMLLKVSETDIVNVKAGQHVQFTITAYSTRQFSGTVSAVSPNGVSTNGKMGFPVIVSIDTGSTQGLTLYPNMTTSATISS